MIPKDGACAGTVAVQGDEAAWAIGNASAQRGVCAVDGL